MSIALDRLSVEERRLIAESLLTEHKPSKDGKLGSHCPFHREGTPGGAFYYHYENDLAYCHSCGANSDLVGIFNAVHGRAVDDSDGCAEFVKTYCPDSYGSRPMPQQRQPRQKRGWEPNQSTFPSEKWQERAESHVNNSIERLQKDEKQLAELAKFGISAETAKVLKFGWNNMDKWVPVTAWGLPYEKNDKGKESKIWLPKGLVIPAFREGKVVKIKVRRPDPMTPWGEERRYWEIKGSVRQYYHVYGHPTYRIWIVVETERDAGMAWFFCNKLRIGAMATGGAAKRPCEYSSGLLRKAKVILNALDYDNSGTKNTYDFWAEEFPNSIRYPAPPSMGKDIGDAFKDGGLDVARWAWAGLPNFAKRFVTDSLAGKAEPEIEVQSESPAPQNNPPQKTFFEQVLEQMESWPQWRQELVNFFDQLKSAEFGIYRFPDDSIQLGLKDSDWERLHKDVSRRTLFTELRNKFYAPRELDPNIGPQCLHDIVEFYFAEKLERRNA